MGYLLCLIVLIRLELAVTNHYYCSYFITFFVFGGSFVGWVSKLFIQSKFDWIPLAGTTLLSLLLLFSSLSPPLPYRLMISRRRTVLNQDRSPLEHQEHQEHQENQENQAYIELLQSYEMYASRFVDSIHNFMHTFSKEHVPHNKVPFSRILVAFLGIIVRELRVIHL